MTDEQWWHAYGPPEGYYLFGPSAADADMAATLGTPARPYVHTWDHDPSDDEIVAAFTAHLGGTP
jgi:hypothetical protein